MIQMDDANLPRMKDYLKPEDLNTDACVELAATVLREQAAALTHAARKAAAHPTKENLQHLEQMREFYESDWFKILSCDLAEADGKEIAQGIVKRAVRGINVRA